MIIYLAGPMTGLPNYNKHEFIMAEIAMSKQNHTVLSPANNIPMYNPDAISHADYLKICFAMIDCCDTVYFLAGWERSKGARMEMDYAIEHGKNLEFEVRG